MTEPGGETAQPVKLQIAQHMIRSVNGITVDSTYLASVIQEITPETQISGTSILHLYIIDPYWAVQRSGLIDTDDTGELANDVDVNFPEGSNLWWRLAMVDGGNDLSDANLELTFIDRSVAYMQDDWGPLSAAPNTRTRAQFVKQLVDRIPRVLHVQPISFVCPELNVIQPVATSTTNTTGGTILASITAATQAKANKTKGLGAGAAITIKGATPNAQQRSNINIALGVANQENAGPIATEALIFAAIAETGIRQETNSSGHKGPWQSTYYAATDVAGAAKGFLTGGPSFGGGGAIAQVKAGVTDPIAIAETVEVGGSYASETGYANFLPEAKAIIAAGGGTTVGSLGTTTGTSTTSGVSDVSQLARGTPQNPDEDSWSCGQRLASEVNFFLFSNGDYLYYMDGPDLIAQQPALYLTLSEDGTSWTATDPVTGKKKAESSASRIITNLKYTFDNTAFQYQSTHKRRGRVQRKTAIRKPQTASQLKFNMICGVFEFRAGDVIVFQAAGAINGRWIVEDTTRNVFADQFTQFTLGPPTIPYPEPQASSTAAGLPGAGTGTGAGAGTTPGSATTALLAGQQGKLAGVAAAAALALSAEQAHPGTYQYSEQVGAARQSGGGLFGPAPRVMDCSKFATLCYQAAGLPDPSHFNFTTIGNTTSIIAHCTKISAGEALPGDLCFFGSSPSATTHVNVYVGNGQSISMGAPGDPHQGPSAQMGPSGFLGYYRSDIASGSSPLPPGSSGVAGLAAPGETRHVQGALGAGETRVVGVDQWLFAKP
jgi:cell wall-associated NlpC family hydrolase